MTLKVLATSWHPGGVDAIVPVIKQLSKDHLVEVVNLGYQYSEKIFADAGIKYKLISNYGANNVSVESMKQILRQENPDLVLTGTSSQDEKNHDVIEQTATLAAKRLSVPTLAVLDFWGGYTPRFNDVYTGEKFKFLPDKIAIMDVYAEKEMLAEGFDKKNLVITGNPHFDGLEQKAQRFTEEQKKALRTAFGLNKEVLLFYAASSWKKDKEEYGYYDLDNIILINETLKEIASQGNDNNGVVIKLHPRTPAEDVEEINQYIKSQGKNMMIAKDITSQELVLATDVTLTPASTVGIEAVYMRKPCISLQPGLKCPDLLAILTKNNIIPVGYTTADCKTLIKKVTTDLHYRKTELAVAASSFRTDGRATERVTKLVYDMLEI